MRIYSTPVQIKYLSPDDWKEWRVMRLKALANSPDAFRSKLQDWSGPNYTEERWRHRLDACPLNVLAVINDHAVGMVAATAPKNEETELISMWVASEARGRGVGDVLIQTVIKWAFTQKVERVELLVNYDNTPAIILYGRNGFLDTGWADGDMTERRMVLELN
jgi:ribosomal protein S18 acetylase RimI-like enzyme